MTWTGHHQIPLQDMNRGLVNYVQDVYRNRHPEGPGRYMLPESIQINEVFIHHNDMYILSLNALRDGDHIQVYTGIFADIAEAEEDPEDDAEVAVED